MEASPHLAHDRTSHLATPLCGPRAPRLSCVLHLSQRKAARTGGGPQSPERVDVGRDELYGSLVSSRTQRKREVQNKTRDLKAVNNAMLHPCPQASLTTCTCTCGRHTFLMSTALALCRASRSPDGRRQSVRVSPDSVSLASLLIQVWRRPSRL